MRRQGCSVTSPPSRREALALGLAVTTLPLLLYNASMSGNYQVSSITALILLAPSLLFMVVIHKFMRPEMMAKLGK